MEKQTLGTDTFIKSKEDTENLSYEPAKKKLSIEEVTALKEEQENLKSEFIKKFINDTINAQNNLLEKSSGNTITAGISKETKDLLTKIFGSVENAYPPLATTQEDAQKAISEGGAYSIDAVADRIMTMAKFIAGDDPDKLQQMREAVEKGFSQAGLDFNKATDSDLPQVCKDTCTEVMRRFDELQGITQGTTSSGNDKKAADN